MLALGVLSIYLKPVGCISFDENSYGKPVLMIIGAVSKSSLIMLLCRRFFSMQNLLGSIFTFFSKQRIFIIGFDYFLVYVSKALLLNIGISHWPTQFLLKILLIMAGISVWTWMINRIHSVRIKKLLAF